MGNSCNGQSNECLPTDKELSAICQKLGIPVNLIFEVLGQLIIVRSSERTKQSLQKFHAEVKQRPSIRNIKSRLNDAKNQNEIMQNVLNFMKSNMQTIKEWETFLQQKLSDCEDEISNSKGYLNQQKSSLISMIQKRSLKKSIHPQSSFSSNVSEEKEECEEQRKREIIYQNQKASDTNPNFSQALNLRQQDKLPVGRIVMGQRDTQKQKHEQNASNTNSISKSSILQIAEQNNQILKGSNQKLIKQAEVKDNQIHLLQGTNKQLKIDHRNYLLSVKAKISEVTYYAERNQLQTLHFPVDSLQGFEEYNAQGSVKRISVRQKQDLQMNQIEVQLAKIVKELVKKQQELVNIVSRCQRLEKQNINLVSEINKLQRSKRKNSHFLDLQTQTIDSFQFMKDSASSNAMLGIDNLGLRDFLFDSKVLKSSSFRQDQKNKLIIQKILKKSKVRSEMLFFFDKVSPNDFNDYVQGKGNLLVLGRLKNDVIVGAYSPDPLQQYEQKAQCSIFTIHPSKQDTEQYYHLVSSPNKNPVFFDRNYLIFGSNQLRFKAKSNEGYTNVGGMSAIYINVAQYFVSFEQFIGSDKREFKTKHLEIYQLQFN